MKKFLVIAFLCPVLFLFASDSAEERFLSGLLMAARRGDVLTFQSLVHPNWLNSGTTPSTQYQQTLRNWARGIIHVEIMSMTVLPDGAVRLTTRVTRKTPQGFRYEILLLDTTPGSDGVPRLLRSTPRIIP